MIGFTLVSEKPNFIDRDQHFIKQLDYLSYIDDARQHISTAKVTKPFFLRKLVDLITAEMAPNFNYMLVNLSPFDGLAFSNDVELSNILDRIIRQEAPVIIYNYLDREFKRRPRLNKLIYYNGPIHDAIIFKKLGCQQVETKDITKFLGLEASLFEKATDKVKEIAKKHRRDRFTSENSNLLDNNLNEGQENE